MANIFLYHFHSFSCRSAPLPLLNHSPSSLGPFAQHLRPPCRARIEQRRPCQCPRGPFLWLPPQTFLGRP